MGNHFIRSIVRAPTSGVVLAAVAIATPVIAADRKSTRLNSSHLVISYAVFCLKKKKQYYTDHQLERSPFSLLAIDGISTGASITPVTHSTLALPVLSARHAPVSDSSSTTYCTP